MEMNRISNNGTSKLEEIREAQQKEAAEKKAEQAKEDKKEWIVKDEYIKSDPKSEKPNGQYSVSQDQNGNKKISFEDPAKPKGNQEPKSKEEGSATMNTDNVDREIKNLKEEKSKLAKQIAMAGDDENKVKQLKQKLSAVESELMSKDNDGYRRSHASVTESD